MDNYLFNFCKNLETVWCKNQVDRIGIQTFGVTSMERLCVNAKNIDISAFAGMESLKEIHIRGGVEHIVWEHLQCCRQSKQSVWKELIQM